MFKVDKIYLLPDEGKRKALVTILINDCFAVSGIRIVNGSNGLFIAMPERKTNDGEFIDICYPINRETRDGLEKLILTAYKNYLDLKKISKGEDNAVHQA